jgi:hypothetical protein
MRKVTLAIICAGAIGLGGIGVANASTHEVATKRHGAGVHATAIRVLPGAPIVTADGQSGVDVNEDGRPDIGLDGSILPGAPVVNGGVDVDGDGRPDIGLNGSILPGAPVVDGGVDVNGDGVPDLA